MPALVEHEVVVADLDPRLDGVRIAQLSDVHVGLTPPDYVRKAVAIANRAEPDIVALTGDYVTWRRRDIPLMAEQISGLRAPNVVVTLGNHDYFSSSRRIATVMADNGYQLLKNQHLTVEVGGAPLHLVGIDDPVTRHHDLDRAFADVPRQGARVVLCHCPEIAGDIAARGADLVLSGHTHGGQVFVEGITDKLIKHMGRQFRSGLYQLDERTTLYVSAGVGFSGVRVRVGAGTRAEVGLLTLRAR
jgi:predicted MPP superfamily phosphohydrolase